MDDMYTGTQYLSASVDKQRIENVFATKHDLEILRLTPKNQLCDAVMLLSPLEAIGIGTEILDVEDILENFDIEDDDGTYRSIILLVSAVLRAFGEPPLDETRITDIQVDTQIARFCRARHQVHFRCPICERGVRHAVTWTPEAGFGYPEVPSCAYCDDHPLLVRSGEMYAYEMPYPFDFDPEPARTDAWRALEVDDVGADLIEAYRQARRA